MAETNDTYVALYAWVKGYGKPNMRRIGDPGKHAKVMYSFPTMSEEDLHKLSLEYNSEYSRTRGVYRLLEMHREFFKEMGDIKWGRTDENDMSFIKQYLNEE